MNDQKPRRIFFNGCSFVHGFDAAWDYASHPRLTDEVRILGSSYWNELQKVNLSGKIGTMLGAEEVINKARNGNNNDVIAYDTIEFFNNIIQDGGDPSEWMVFIGWTEPARIMVFDETNSYAAMTFNPFNINDLIKKTSTYDNDRMKYLHGFYERQREFSKSFMMGATPTWLANQLLRSVLNLQFFLKSVGIRYVFWNSIYPMPRPNGTYLPRIVGNLIDHLSWLPAWETTELPVFTSWLPIIEKPMLTDSEHPTKAAIDSFASTILRFVQKNHGISA